MNATPNPTPPKTANTTSDRNPTTPNPAEEAPLCAALTPVCCTLPGLPGLGEVDVAAPDAAAVEDEAAGEEVDADPAADDDEPESVVKPVAAPPPEMVGMEDVVARVDDGVVCCAVAAALTRRARKVVVGFMVAPWTLGVGGVGEWVGNLFDRSFDSCRCL